jgi:mono/diheme cytochrome c family protein
MSLPKVRPTAWLAGLVLLGGLVAAMPARHGQGAEAGMSNPFLGQAEAIGEGERIYRGRCIGCHGRGGSRGPNLFGSKLSPEQFMLTVINGRKGTNMAPFGYLLSPDEVWKIHAFVMSRDRL